MKNDYVSYKLALALKKAGFCESCDHIYLRDRKSNEWEFADWKVDDKDYNKRTRPQLAISAPTLWQAQKWLREVKGIAINVIAHDRSDKYREGKYHWMEVHLPNSNENGHQWMDWFIYGKHPLFDTYEEALSDGLSQMLGLIDNDKQ